MPEVYITVTARTPEDLKDAADHAVQILRDDPGVPEYSDAHDSAAFTLSPQPPTATAHWELLERHDDPRSGPQYRCIGRFSSAQEGLDALGPNVTRLGLQIIDVSDQTVHICSEREILWMLQIPPRPTGLHHRPDWAYAARVVRQERGRPDRLQCRVLISEDFDGTLIRIVRQDTGADIVCWRGAETAALLADGELDAGNLSASALTYAAVLGLIREDAACAH